MHFQAAAAPMIDVGVPARQIMTRVNREHFRSHHCRVGCMISVQIRENALEVIDSRKV
jgi:hypothetical protein